MNRAPDASALRIVLLATRRMGLEALRLISSMGFDIVALYAQEYDITDGCTIEVFRDEARGRSVPFVAKENVAEDIERLRQSRPDLLVSAYWRRLVSPDLLAIFPLGGVNIHQAPLPRFRGFAPQNWAILLGEPRSGVSLHYMAKRADAGDLIAQRFYPIGPRDTIADLERHGLEGALEMLRHALPQLAAGTAPRIPQNDSSALYSFPRYPIDGEIDWSWTATEIDRLVRAVSRPYPGAYTFDGERKIFVWEAAPVEAPFRYVAMPGSVVGHDDRAGTAWIATGRGTLALGRVQPENGPEVAGSALLGSVRRRLGAGRAPQRPGVDR